MFFMKATLIRSLNDPKQLEELYRKDKLSFTQAFNELDASQKDQQYFIFWNTRLNYKEKKSIIIDRKEILCIIILAIVAGIVANISNLPGVEKELFFTRNTAFLIFPFISAYFIWKQKLSFNKKIIIGGAIAVLALYLNCLPNNSKSSSIQLIYIHLPILLWSILGYAYLGNDFFNKEKRINYLKYNGDLLIMSGVLLLSCILFTLITFGLFELIGIKIEQFYMQHIAIWAIGAIPILATYLIYNNPNLTNWISPLIAKIFTPLVFMNLLIYLSALIYMGKYPFNDRNLLLINNLLLVAVLALIFFSIVEKGKNKNQFFTSILLLGLSFLTICINIIALSAILFRLWTWGITPNRVVVLGSNVLVFINLIIVFIALIKVIRKKEALVKVQDCIASYLPIYAAWAGFVVLLLPLLFAWR